MFGYEPPRERCAAEIGRPGNYHGCKRLGTRLVERDIAAGLLRWRSRLYYCAIHEARARRATGVLNPIGSTAAADLCTERSRVVGS